MSTITNLVRLDMDFTLPKPSHHGTFYKSRFVIIIRFDLASLGFLSWSWEAYVHKGKIICQDILNYYISTFGSQLCRRGRGVPSILYVEDFFKQKDITEPSFRNFYSNGLSWETLKLCLDFLWNTTSFWYILWLQVEHLDLIILWRKISGFFFLIQRIYWWNGQKWSL